MMLDRDMPFILAFIDFVLDSGNLPVVARRKSRNGRMAVDAKG